MDLMSLARWSRPIVISLSIVLVSASTHTHAQSIVREWRRVFDSGGVDRASGIDVTPEGDVYVVGRTTMQDTTRLVLLHYGHDGNLRWSRLLGSGEWYTGPMLTVDPTGRAVVTGFNTDMPPCDGGFVVRFDTDGQTLWTRCLQASSFPRKVQCYRADRIHVASSQDWGMGLWLPELAILSLDGDIVCDNYPVCYRFGVSDALVVQDGSTLFIGNGGEEFDGPIRMARLDEACGATWLGAVGIGGRSTAVTVIEGARCGAVFIGNIEVRGDYDVWLGCYGVFDILDARGFHSFDMAGRNDRAVAAAADEWLGTLTGTTESASIDVLIGTFYGTEHSLGDSWWTYDGPAGGDDRGIDIGFLPSGEIVVLAQVAGTVDNRQALLLYGRDGQLLDADLDSFNDNPTGLAITSDGAIYTAAWNPESAPHAPGDVIVNKYSVSAIGVGSAQAPAVLRVGAPEPNPSPGSVTIPYELPVDGELTIGIYDASGRLIRTLATGRGVRGRHEVVWDGLTDSGESVASGVYFVRFDFGNRVERRQVVLAR